MFDDEALPARSDLGVPFEVESSLDTEEAMKEPGVVDEELAAT